ncbi:uncharacterized protein E0L32_002116 [Thyridium curvatum]|uniref:Amidohydrolase-related domain-containing protein n=1 Tax=Thyridium curvatum TaxID=1093900 RepID=A0A507AJM6_9PEZI|nr:uncharacterized protein E0L32_002017 [Thyridium curvatum]XP_030989224.1 uncharacterized protein E0L32_002116 [Thyridium curvatum]TPX07414.1 hypothetical protein E0L32_002017 [Thyridium curvatum]TPX07513.1 hypothetical protein E0L32_002116 [Thyridium curvatum]
MATKQESGILLRGGTVLAHDEDMHVRPLRADVLIKGNTIVKISEDLSVPVGTEVIDCIGKLLCPGFVNGHQHIWQTALKGQHANDTLVPYMPTGNLTSALYTLEDAFWGELSGAMESIDCGTTTVVDHSSLNQGPDYPKTILRALATSGLRATYAYCHPRIVTSWNPLKYADDSTSPWVMDTYEQLFAPCSDLGDNGRVRPGFAVDAIFGPSEPLQKLYKRIRSAGTAVITTHSCGGVMLHNGPSAAQILYQHGLLGPDILLSHATFPHDGDVELLRKAGAAVCTTPLTELQMGQPPVALEDDYYELASLGVDCHSWGSSFMPGQMRLLLQWARCDRAGRLLKEKGQWSLGTGVDVEKVFNLGTALGARAIGMGDQVGQIKEGYKADMVIFDTDTPSMCAAALDDPVAAIVLHSSERDVGTVIVDGVVRKQGGKLLDITATPAVGRQTTQVSGVEEGRKFSWNDVVARLLESRARIKKEMEGIDWESAVDSMIDLMHCDRSSLKQDH